MDKYEAMVVKQMLSMLKSDNNLLIILGMLQFTTLVLMTLIVVNK